MCSRVHVPLCLSRSQPWEATAVRARMLPVKMGDVIRSDGLVEAKDGSVASASGISVWAFAHLRRAVHVCGLRSMSGLLPAADF